MSNFPITASPLTWPAGWKRTKKPVDSAFYDHTVDKATKFILQQLHIMRVKRKDVIISTNLRLRLDGLPYSKQRGPEDAGIAVYWRDPDGMAQVMPLDKYWYIEDNLWAVGKTLEALRGIERWGDGQILNRAFAGFVALPPPDKAGGVDPHQIIGIDSDAKAHEKIRAFRSALSRAHPDRGGSLDQFHAVKEAGKALGLGR